mmetsp:Transcript_5396/g.8186  ORF Transcript_5396/g.8186 Transcript_5396/m.8186 type:complete len:449 (+) Transcript_5396:2230-3576(+)
MNNQDQGLYQQTNLRNTSEEEDQEGESMEQRQKWEKAQDGINKVLQRMIEPGKYALIEGLVQRTELNGTRVRVVRWNEKKGRWKVELMNRADDDNSTETVVGEKVMATPRNLLPCFQKQSTLELKEFVAETCDAVKEQALGSCVNKDVHSAWDLIGRGYQRCPMLVWHQAFEVLFGRRPLLALYASFLQRSLSYGEDGPLVNRMKNALRRSEDGYVSSCNHDSMISDDIDRIDDVEDRKAIFWFLVYAQLDDEDWVGAMESLVHVFADIRSGQWPQFFWPEALYYKALADFGLGKRSECNRSLLIYDSIAHPNDRHHRDASILRLWAGDTSTERIETSLANIHAEHERISPLWDGDTYSKRSYVWVKVAESLGVEDEDDSPGTMIAELLRNQWTELGFIPTSAQESINITTAPGFPHGVTVRFRVSHDDQKRQDEADERNAMRMYEDR